MEEPFISLTEERIQSRGSIKNMLIVLFNIPHIVHREFLPRDQTVDREFYIDILNRLKKEIRWKRPDL